MDTLFEKGLMHLINKHSMENESNTSDYILAKFLTNCLEAFNQAIRQRENSLGQYHNVVVADEVDKKLAEEVNG